MKETITLNGKTYQLIEDKKKEFITVTREIKKEYEICPTNLEPVNKNDLGEWCWENNWNYYFTYDRAIEEAEKQWLRLLTKDEWNDIINDWKWIWQWWIADKLWLQLLGNRTYGNFYHQGSYGYYWSSTTYDGLHSWGKYFCTPWGYCSNYDKTFGFSVRCVKK